MNQTATAQSLSSSTQNIKLCYLIFFILYFTFIHRYPCCNGRVIAVYCSQNGRDQKFCSWRIVRTALHMLIYLFNQSIIYLFTNFAMRPGTLTEQAPLHSISVWLYIMVWNTTFPRIIEGGDNFLFRTKRGRLFEGGDYFKYYLS